MMRRHVALVVFGVLLVGGMLLHFGAAPQASLTGTNAGLNGATGASGPSGPAGPTGATGPAGVAINIPQSFLYTGAAGEGAETITAVVKLQGYHEFSTLDIHGAGQLQVDAFQWVFIRATSCNIATTTATCVKGDGTNDTDCAIDATGANPNVPVALSAPYGVYGGTSGGTGWSAQDAGSLNGNGEALTHAPTVAGGIGAVDNAHAGSAGIPIPQATQEAMLPSLANIEFLGFTAPWQTAAPAETAGAFVPGGAASFSVNGNHDHAGGSVVVLICGAVTAKTGHIVATGLKGIQGDGNGCGSNFEGGPGTGGGAVLVAGPGGYTQANILIDGGTGAAGCAAGSTAGGNGAKGNGFNVDTTTGTITYF